MSYVEEMNLLGGRKIVVGDSKHNLVLANAGSVYVQYGNSYKKLTDLIQDLVEKGVQLGIEEYKAELEEEKKATESEVPEDTTPDQNSLEEETEGQSEESTVDVELLLNDFNALKQLVTNMVTDLLRAGYLISNLDEFDDLEQWVSSHNYACSERDADNYLDESSRIILKEVRYHDQDYIARSLKNNEGDSCF